MAHTSLASAVENFAARTHTFTDQDLESKWTWGDYDEGVRFVFFRVYEDLRQLAARLLAERSASGTPLTAAQYILVGYQAAYRDLQAVTLGVSEEAASREPAEGEWPLVRVVLHIVGAERAFYAVNHYAVERLSVAEERPEEMPDETWEAYWASDDFEQVIESQSLSKAMAYYAALHQRVIADFAGMQEAELEAPAVFWESQPMLVEFRLHRFDSHLRQHTIQAEKTLEMLALSPNEAKRLLRLIYNALAQVEAVVLGAPDFGLPRRQALAEKIANWADELEALVKG
jgi:hypothetical protein